MLRKLLFPLSLIWGLILRLRHLLYDWGLIRSYEAPVPVIVIGNLSLGGTGKTPHTLFAGKILEEYYKIALLSRGHGRRTSGYREVHLNDSAESCGDEPLIFKSHFPDIPVVVCEDRVEGIRRILEDHPETELILLDDAFQHRKLKPGFSIVLFDYSSLQKADCLVPAGNLRDLWQRRLKADLLLVTKSPENLSEPEKQKFIARLKPAKNQLVLFSRYHYEEAKSYSGTGSIPLNELSRYKIRLVTGIARPKPLLKKLDSLGCSYIHSRFRDHHTFTQKDIQRLYENYDKFADAVTIWLSTEKDKVKISPILDEADRKNWFYIPVEVAPDDPQILKKTLLDYVRTDIRKRKIHT